MRKDKSLRDLIAAGRKLIVSASLNAPQLSTDLDEFKTLLDKVEKESGK